MRKKISEMDMLSKPQIINIIRREKLPRNRALIAMLYLTGARISEVLQVKRGDIWAEEVFGKKFIVIKMRTLKKRDRTEHRNIPISVETDRDVLKYLIRWANENKSPEALLFTIGRQWAWRIMNKHGLFNHYWRHCRNTHLVTKRGFTDQELVKFNGWASANSASIYTHLNWKDIAKKL